ncbi:50S ribosomal protein L24 [Francisella halioticida]|uniref:50S ribosomal protein L24 n=1 Tax=Francisella halioticida TaxID=549298 RepID=UPI001AF5461E|nr:50S ribosomal protein L24 [Francisella halioticida]BCD92575.1 50S ribosomal protein L24 [Francisella halioticida]
MNRLKKGDDVIVVAGKDKGRRGVVKSFAKGDSLVLVEGINVVKKHVKPNPNKGVEGGVVEKELPVDASNVAIFNPTTEKADRVGYKFVDEKKVRYFKSNGELVDL